MTAAQLELPDDTEEERVIRWRISKLTQAGYRWPASLLIAASVQPMVVAEQLGHSDARLVLHPNGHLWGALTRFWVCRS